MARNLLLLRFSHFEGVLKHEPSHTFLARRSGKASLVGVEVHVGDVGDEVAEVYFGQCRFQVANIQLVEKSVFIFLLPIGVEEDGQSNLVLVTLFEVELKLSSKEVSIHCVLRG